MIVDWKGNWFWHGCYVAIIVAIITEKTSFFYKIESCNTFIINNSAVNKPASGVEGRGFESRRVYHFFCLFNNRKQSRKKQILTLTNSFVRQDFFFLLNIFCDAKNGIAYFVAGCPALLDLRSALLAHFVASLLVESRRVYHFFCLFVGLWQKLIMISRLKFPAVIAFSNPVYSEKIPVYLTVSGKIPEKALPVVWTAGKNDRDHHIRGGRR